MEEELISSSVLSLPVLMLRLMLLLERENQLTWSTGTSAIFLRQNASLLT